MKLWKAIIDNKGAEEIQKHVLHDKPYNEEVAVTSIIVFVSLAELRCQLMIECECSAWDTTNHSLFGSWRVELFVQKERWYICNRHETQAANGRGGQGSQPAKHAVPNQLKLIFLILFF